MTEIKGKCGTDCNTCGFRERVHCSGCPTQAGKVFWGECDTFHCAASRNLEHCGECNELPCKDLLELIENGHNPVRMTNLLRWKEESQR